MTPETTKRREQLRQYIEDVLAPDPAVQAVIGIGGVATGHLHGHSALEAILFLHPFDHYVAPAEAIWQPADDTYHSIFSEDPALWEDGVPLNLLRLDWGQWADEDHSWPEPRKAELSTGWVAFDRTGAVGKTIENRTAYPDDLQFERLDEAIIWLDRHLGEDELAHVWEEVEPTVAHHRLQLAYENLVQALFAFNRHWHPDRNREMGYLLNLSWLPHKFADRVQAAAIPPGLDQESFRTRAQTVRDLFQELLEQLTASGLYSNIPVDQALLRRHDEPGRAWNLDEWVKYHTVRKMSRNA